MPAADTKTQQLLYALGHRGASTAVASGCCNTKTQEYILDAITRLDNLQNEVDAWKNAPDVVDIVATKAELDAYPTTDLTNKDIIRVLSDETHDGKSYYYRWTITGGTGSWVAIGPVNNYVTEVFTFTLADSTVVTKNIVVEA